MSDYYVFKCVNCNYHGRQPASLGIPVKCPTCGAKQCVENGAGMDPSARVTGSVTSGYGSPSSNVMPRIAIIGTEGSGKTVLITTLAKRFSRVSPNGAFLYPLDNNTMRYVERNWLTLCSSEWPAGTPLGQLFELRWSLECGGDSNIRCELRIADAAGQDLRRLFNDDEPASGQNYPSQLQKLDAYCKEADIVICLVNLRDFVGEGNPERRLDNEVVIKSALQRLSTDPARRLCLLFTQIDLHQPILKKYGNWGRIAETVLPYVHGAHFRKGQAIVRAVASVNKTVTTADANKRLRRVPASDFESFGFDGLMDWLVKEVRAIVASGEGLSHQIERNQQVAVQPVIGEMQLKNWTKQKDLQKDLIEKVIAALVALGAIVLGISTWAPIAVIAPILILLLWRCSEPPASRLLPVQQGRKSFKVSAYITYGRFYHDISIRNDASITLMELVVTVIVWRNEVPIESRRLQVSNLPAGEFHTWRNVFALSRTETLELRIVSYR